MSLNVLLSCLVFEKVTLVGQDSSEIVLTNFDSLQPCDFVGCSVVSIFTFGVNSFRVYYKGDLSLKLKKSKGLI